MAARFSPTASALCCNRISANGEDPFLHKGFFCKESSDVTEAWMDATSFSWLATGYSKFDPVFVKPCRQSMHKTLRTDRSLSASTQTTAMEDLSVHICFL